MDVKEKVLVQINGGIKGSTGKIMFGIADEAIKNGYAVYTFGPPGKSQITQRKNHFHIGTVIERRISEKINKLTGHQDCLNLVGTAGLIVHLKKLRPSIVHLHVIHNNYLNLRMVFNFLKRHNIPIVWTFHDCWAFTGQCPYFEIVGCEKWKKECYDCPMIHEYPSMKRDGSTWSFRRKKALYADLSNLTIVTPSRWLADLTRESFLKKHEPKIIYNGIDLSFFQPKRGQFREKYGLQKKFVILSIAFSWGYRKGQDRIERLAENLDDRFKIVVVGTTKVNSDKILSIGRTENQEQLSEIYSGSDVLFNPTREDNFPTVNIEALACGLPVLSYGAGGSAEAFDKDSGMIVNDENIIQVLNELYEHPFDREKCARRGREFDQTVKFKEYVELYEKIAGKSQESH